jgi:hypothetical protein
VRGLRCGDLTACQAVESPPDGTGAALRGSDSLSDGGIPTGRSAGRAAGICPPVRRPGADLTSDRIHRGRRLGASN